MSIVPIVFAFDDRMMLAAEVCITSLLINACQQTFYEIIVLHEEGRDLTSSRLGEFPGLFHNCSIRFVSIPDDYAHSYQVRGITSATYYRLLAADMLPEYNQFLYSDVDVIFREDLSSYFQIDLGKQYFAGVNSVPVMNEDYLKHLHSIGLKPDDGYYYAGNLVVNAAQLRNDGMSKVFLAHKDKKYLFQDMDIINLTCRGRIMGLPPVFCLTNNYYRAITSHRESLKGYFSDEEMDAAIQRGIVHYNGPKPWEEICLNMDIWWDYYRRSSFFDEQFASEFWFNQSYRLEKMSLLKRIKLVGRYFRKGGRL